MNAVRLGPEHAEVLAELEQTCLERLRYKLGLLAQAEASFCWGLVEEDQLAG